MTNYFTGCTTLDALKARYREMAKALHPDLHPELGDEPVKALNRQFDDLCAKLSRVSRDGRTEATAQEAAAAREDASAYRAVVEKIIHLHGLDVELCGCWLWVSGNTYAHRDALKAAGLRWSSKKQMWYWRPDEAACTRRHRSASIGKIRCKYGSISSTGDDFPRRAAIAD